MFQADNEKSKKYKERNKTAKSRKNQNSRKEEKFAQNDYKSKHEWMWKVIHSKLCKKVEFELITKL